MTARAVAGRGPCWRCAPSNGTAPEVVLVHDPMMPPGDTVGVCVTCAVEREQVKINHAKRLGH